MLLFCKDGSGDLSLKLLVQGGGCYVAVFLLRSRVPSDL